MARAKISLPHPNSILMGLRNKPKLVRSPRETRKDENALIQDPGDLFRERSRSVNGRAGMTDQIRCRQGVDGPARMRLRLFTQKMQLQPGVTSCGPFSKASCMAASIISTIIRQSAAARTLCCVFRS